MKRFKWYLKGSMFFIQKNININCVIQEYSAIYYHMSWELCWYKTSFNSGNVEVFHTNASSSILTCFCKNQTMSDKLMKLATAKGTIHLLHSVT